MKGRANTRPFCYQETLEMSTTSVRHASLKGEPINTRYGEVQLDEKGYVTNLDQLKCTPEELINDIPGFINGEAFGGPVEEAEVEQEVDESTDWMTETNGVKVEGPNEGGWYAVTYADGDKSSEENVQDEEAARAKAEEWRNTPPQPTEGNEGNDGAPAADETQASDNTASGAASEDEAAKSDESKPADEQQAEAADDAKKDGKEATDEELWAVIAELEAAENPKLNSQGYVDMEALNSVLREKGFEIVTGGKRKEVTDKFRPKK